MLNTLKIPKKLMDQGDLVVIPRKEYERLLKRNSRISDKQQKLYAQLNRELNKSIQEYRQGKAIGPFSSVSELKKSLEK